MGGTYRPIYEDEQVELQWDTTSQWAVAAPSVSATNFQPIAGATVWTIQIPDSVSGVAGGKCGNLIVQVNNARPVMRADVSGIPWTVNPLLNQPSEGKRNRIAINPSFTGSWTSIGVIGGTVSISAFPVPARYVRLTGVGVTAMVKSSSAALVWSSGMSQGN